MSFSNDGRREQMSSILSFDGDKFVEYSKLMDP
jgi:hypothetical protein